MGTFGYPSWFANAGGDGGFKPIKYGDPKGKYYMPAMSDSPVRGYIGRHEWFWVPGDEAHIFPLKNLKDMYYKSVGRNFALIKGLTPAPDGLIPIPDVDRLREWGEEIKNRFSKPIAKTTVTGSQIILSLMGDQQIENIILQEEISKGERVREFNIQGKIGGKWQNIYQGSNIGHKHIIEIEPIKTNGLRLIISKTKDTP
ncbi:hypothetical protein [Arenibacter certesii]|uniref:Uncharacterized protein n=1 Tax=Arenibacter certesii TaxID=228955 RepID=A0A918J5M3_9FLAO|nr:hypothetical protein [Arenibacter certesii]GGW48248.1 hypothetical protein GCM10007383_35390 [Arenibacter certesii]